MLESAIRERESTISEREQRILELEAHTRERETAIREREATIRERERILEELDAAVRERELLLGRKAAKLAELDRRIALHAGQKAGQNAVSATGAPAAEDAGGNGRGALPEAAQRLPPLDDIFLSVHAKQAVPGAEAASEADAAALRRWAAVAETYRASELLGDQRLIAPYLVRRYMNGAPFKLLIATREAQRWYDCLDLTEIPSCGVFGMLTPGATVFDCGANNGVNAVCFAQTVGPSGRVLAFDPFPLNVQIARFNAELNGLNNIEVLPLGLSNKRTEAYTSVSEQCITPTGQGAADTVKIALERLDSFAHLRPQFLKIDIEGAEVDALEGAQEILSQRPFAQVELHPTFLPRFGRSMMDVFRYVDLNAYSCFINYPGLPPFHPYEMEFELEDYCYLYLVPRSRPPVTRYFIP